MFRLGPLTTQSLDRQLGDTLRNPVLRIKIKIRLNREYLGFLNISELNKRTFIDY